MRLIDKIRVEVRAGKGGNGIIAYTAHKLKRLIGPGIPCGGNGGRGGDIRVTAKSTTRTLASIQPVITAGNGMNGGKERFNGSPGSDVNIPVPLGVSIFDAQSKLLIADLDTDNQSVVVARGGTGGRGNNMARPHECTKGDPGTTVKLIFELKTIADIGLVGFPNAGKSSLLSMMSRATPRVAPYPFTTLSPFVGTLGNTRIADLPGLVEEAHLNRGMGHEFLRHIERTKALLFVIDSTCQHWNPRIADKMGSVESVLRTLRQEVVLYNEGQLREKPWGVVCNKTEAGQRLDSIDALDRTLRAITNPDDIMYGCRGVVATSCKFGLGKMGVVDLIDRLMSGVASKNSL